MRVQIFTQEYIGNILKKIFFWRKPFGSKVESKQSISKWCKLRFVQILISEGRVGPQWWVRYRGFFGNLCRNLGGGVKHWNVYGKLFKKSSSQRPFDQKMWKLPHGSVGLCLFNYGEGGSHIGICLGICRNGGGVGQTCSTSTNMFKS